MQILRSKVLHLAVVMLAAFVPLVIVVPPGTLYLYTGSVLLTTTFAFMHAYWPALKYSIKLAANELERVDILTLALFIAFAAIGFRESYVILTRELFPVQGGRTPEYFIFLALMQYSTLVSALLAISARNDEKIGPLFMRRVPGWPRAILSIIAGFVLATGLYLMR